MNDKLELFVKKVVYHSGMRQPYEITEVEDGKRIYFVVEKPDFTKYIIRTWSIDEKGIDFTLYKDTDSEMVEVMTERYYFSTGRFYKRVG